MIYSNLAGTTSDEFNIGASGTGKIISKNAYDIFWSGNADGSRVNLNVKRILVGTDLNTITDVCQYYMPNNSEVPSLKNSPTKKAFIMIVEPCTGALQSYKYIVQKITDFDGDMYTRGYNGYLDVWTNWKQMTYKSDVPIESGVFSFTPTDSRVRLTNTSGNYNRVGSMVFIKVETVLAIVNNSPVVDIAFKGLPYLCEVNRFMYGSCNMSYYPISPTIFSYGNIIEVDTSYDSFRIRFTVPINSSGVIHLDRSTVFGNLVKVDTNVSLTGGFWYQTV